jgi:hypothetical protein
MSDERPDHAVHKQRTGLLTGPAATLKAQPANFKLFAVAAILALIGGGAIWLVDNTTGQIFQRYTSTTAGSYSDFSQSWVGTRVALGERANPYSAAVRPRIQALYYGHPLQPDDPHRPAHPQGFYYPLYIVWLLWPLALLPFPLASPLFKLLALGLLAGGTWAYLRTLGWPASRTAQLALALGGVLTLGGQTVVRVEQPTVLAYGLLLGAVYCAWRGRYGWMGVFLALAWIKPQLALLPALGLGLWAIAVPARRAAVRTGTGTAAALLISSLLLQPDWIGQWTQTFEGYSAATAGVAAVSSYGVLDWLGVIVRLGIVAGTAALWWTVRHRSAGDWRVQWVVAGTFVATAAVQQPWFTYNLVLLYPPVLFLLAMLLRPGRGPATPPRLLGWLAVGLFVAPGAVDLLLYGVYVLGTLPPESVDWPGFYSLAGLVRRALTDFVVLLLLFTYTAWAATVWIPARAGTESALIAGQHEG